MEKRNNRGRSHSESRHGNRAGNYGNRSGARDRAGGIKLSPAAHSTVVRTADPPVLTEANQRTFREYEGRQSREVEFGVDLVQGRMTNGTVGFWYQSTWIFDKKKSAPADWKSNGNLMYTLWNKDAEAKSSVCLQIDGMSSDWSRAGLFDRLRWFGPIVVYEIAMAGGKVEDEESYYLGFGYVQYRYPEDCVSAWKQFEHNGNRKLFLRKCYKEYDVGNYCTRDLRGLSWNISPRIDISCEQKTFLDCSYCREWGYNLKAQCDVDKEYRDWKYRSSR